MRVLLLLLLAATSSVIAQNPTTVESTTPGVHTKATSADDGTTTVATERIMETTVSGTTPVSETTQAKETTASKVETTTGKVEIPTTTHAPEIPTTTHAPEVPTTTHAPEVPTTTHAPEIPTTTHAPEVPTTTIAPQPKKPSYEKVRDWEVTNHTSNVTCLKVTIAVQFAIPYNRTDNKTVTAYVNLDTNATVTDYSSCADNVDVLDLTWRNELYNLTLSFTNNGTEKQYGLTMVSFAYQINDKDFPGASEAVGTATSVSTKVDFNSKLVGHLGKSYKCDAEGKVEVQNVEMSWEKVQVQAFMTSKDYGTAEECPADDKTDDIVPIAVGCALAGLVIIVLIAYMVGRRRSRQKGYQSV